MSAARTLVSVVVPIHNASAYLDRTRAQLAALDDSVDYQFVLIDDHSTDDSRERIAGWIDALPGEVSILDADARGVANARNQALGSCRGTFVWLTDADDQWEPGIVAQMCAAALAEEADLVVCNASKRTPDGRDVGEILDAPVAETTDGVEALRRLLNGELQGHLWNKLFARELLGLDPFPVTRAHSDLGGVLRILPRAARVRYLPESLYAYIQNPGSILNSTAYDFGDLRGCLVIAKDSSDRAGIGERARDPLVRFTYRNVVLPSLNEIARRKQALTRERAQDEQARLRELMTWSDVLRLGRIGPTRLALQGAAAKMSTGGYIELYRRAIAVRRRLPQAT